MKSQEKQSQPSTLKKKNSKKKPKTDNLRMDLPTLEKFAHWIRNNSSLDSYSGVTRDRRIDFFRGDEFVDALVSKRCSKKKFTPSPLNRQQAMRIGDAMLKQQFFHQSEQLNHPKKTDDDAIKIIPNQKTNRMVDEDEAVYTWLVTASHTRVYIMSALLLLSAIFLCVFRVWPLPLKIFVWWCSLILLITLSTLFVIRLIFAALFWIVGFRGLWLLPNLFNEEIDTMDTFTPLIGYGIDSKIGRKEERRKAKAEKEAKKQKKKDKKKGITKKSESKKETDAPRETVVEGRFDDCNFGMINFFIIGIIAIICCNYLGLFMSDNIPDFIISQNELWKRYPGLAPPNASQPIINETEKVSPPEGIEDIEEDDGIDMSKFIDEVEEEAEIVDDLDDIAEEEEEEEAETGKKSEL